MNGESVGPAAPGTNPGGLPLDLKPGAFRVVTLEKGSGAAVAEKLKRLMEQMRPNPVYLSTPGGQQRRRQAGAGRAAAHVEGRPRGQEAGRPRRRDPGVPEAGRRRQAGPAGRSAGEKEPQAGGKEGQQPAAGDDRGVRQQDHHLVGRPGGAGDGPAAVAAGDADDGRRRRFRGDPPAQRQRRGGRQAARPGLQRAEADHGAAAARGAGRLRPALPSVRRGQQRAGPRKPAARHGSRRRRPRDQLAAGESQAGGHADHPLPARQGHRLHRQGPGRRAEDANRRAAQVRPRGRHIRPAFQHLPRPDGPEPDAFRPRRPRRVRPGHRRLAEPQRGRQRPAAGGHAQDRGGRADQQSAGQQHRIALHRDQRRGLEAGCVRQEQRQDVPDRPAQGRRSDGGGADRGRHPGPRHGAAVQRRVVHSVADERVPRLAGRLPTGRGLPARRRRLPRDARTGKKTRRAGPAPAGSRTTRAGFF